MGNSIDSDWRDTVSDNWKRSKYSASHAILIKHWGFLLLVVDEKYIARAKQQRLSVGSRGFHLPFLWPISTLARPSDCCACIMGRVISGEWLVRARSLSWVGLRRANARPKSPFLSSSQRERAAQWSRDTSLFVTAIKRKQSNVRAKLPPPPPSLSSLFARKPTLL